MFVLLRRYIASGSVLFFSATSQLAAFAILARALGIQQMGAVILITAVTTLAASACGLGASDTIVRGLARDRRRYPELVGHGLTLIGGTGIALTIVSTAALVLLFRMSQVAEESWTTFLFFSIANIPLFALVTFVERIFIGRQDFVRANLVNMGQALVRLATTVAACLLFQVTTLSDWAVWLVAGQGIAAAFCGAMLVRGGRPVWRVDWGELRLGIHYTTPFFVDALRENADRLTLGLIVPSSVIGAYGTAMRMGQMSQIVVHSLNRIVYPLSAGQIHRGTVTAMGMARVYGLAIVGLSIVTGALVFLVAPILPILLGAEYARVVTDLRIVCWLIVPIAIQTVPYDLLGAIDQHARRASVYNSLSLVGLVVTVVAILAAGLIGAFVAAYLVQTMLALGLWVAFRQTVARGAAGQLTG
ncbi:MAG: lipopolysaccharide biosynthesis protein [Rhizobiales bacterium]|nr:lipopolysaccharide biosynthesis protein [Hyphomicrobiales bacterium]